MIYLIWLVGSILVAHLASKKGQSGIGMLFVSLLLSPLFGFIFLLMLEDKTDQMKIKNKAYKKCPKCAELIKYEAVKCKFCGESLE